jgi:hypothetical protein
VIKKAAVASRLELPDVRFPVALRRGRKSGVGLEKGPAPYAIQGSARGEDRAAARLVRTAARDPAFAGAYSGSEETQDRLVRLVGEAERLHRKLLARLEGGEIRAFLVDVGNGERIGCL